MRSLPKDVEFVKFFWDNSHGLSNIVEIHAEIQPKIFFFFFGKRCKLVNKTDCGPYSHFVTPWQHCDRKEEGTYLKAKPRDDF